MEPLWWEDNLVVAIITIATIGYKVWGAKQPASNVHSTYPDVEGYPMQQNKDAATEVVNSTGETVAGGRTLRYPDEEMGAGGRVDGEY